MIKALLLDLDGTLLDDKAAMTAAKQAFYKVHANARSDETFDEFSLRWSSTAAQCWERFLSGELSFTGQQRERVRIVLDRNLLDAEATEAFAPYLSAYEHAWSCYEDVAGFLQRTKGLKKIAVTNGQREQQRAKMERTGLLRDIPDLVTPENAGGLETGCQNIQPCLGGSWDKG